MRYVMLFVLGLLTATAQAQTWTVFVPMERDFRILFPSPPVRSAEADGSTAFRSRFGDLQYSVYRLPPGTRPGRNARRDIARHIQVRARDEGAGLQYLGERSGGALGWEGHVFGHGAAASVHRVVEHAGRVYELEVAMPRESAQKAMYFARDFFNSFHLTGVGLPSVATITQSIEIWCKDRADVFSQAFCRYSICLQPGYQKYPHCSALSGLKDLF